MQKSLITCVTLALISFSLNAQTVTDFFPKADAFLKKYVTHGSVAYAKVKQSKDIDALYQEIGTISLAQAADVEKMAFYINAYNLIVIYYAAKHYPLKSPLDQSGFFDMVKHRVAGEEMTLNSLEIKKLLATYKDARFHFALACAAKSCPPLASFAYTPQLLEKQLQERAMAALNNPLWLKVNARNKKVELSKIFEWYKKDFTAGGKTEIEWINTFRKEKIPADFTVTYYEYDWRLNDQ